MRYKSFPLIICSFFLLIGCEEENEKEKVRLSPMEVLTTNTGLEIPRIGKQVKEIKSDLKFIRMQLEKQSKDDQ